MKSKCLGGARRLRSIYSCGMTYRGLVIDDLDLLVKSQVLIGYLRFPITHERITQIKKRSEECSEGYAICKHQDFNSKLGCLPSALQRAHLLDEVISDLFIGDLMLSLDYGFDLH